MGVLRGTERKERGHVVACRPKLLPQPDFPYCDGEHEEILRPFEINMRVYTLLCMKKKIVQYKYRSS